MGLRFCGSRVQRKSLIIIIIVVVTRTDKNQIIFFPDFASTVPTENVINPTNLGKTLKTIEDKIPQVNGGEKLSIFASPRESAIK